MPKNLTLILLASVVASSIVHLHAADVSPIAIGWRGDGYSGVMPPDCKPPKDFDGITGKNLRWKSPLPNHGNSSPIVVGNKVFVTCDGGWPEGQDCPQLLCFDANNGKELWRRNLDHFDNLPEAEAKAAKADRAEYWKQHHEACTILWELRHGTPDAARQTAIIERLKALGCEAREPVLEWFQKKFNGVMGMLCQADLAKRLKKVGFESPTWGWRCMGVVMPTPASDGRAVYVATGFRTMSAFDLDGKKLWQEVITQSIPTEGAFFTEEFAHSPFLVDGKLLMHWFNHLWCYEPTSGKLLWSTKTKPIPAHSMGQPTVLHLDAGGKSVTCIFTTWGQLIRLFDGKVLLDKIAWFGCNAVMSGDGKDVVWGVNGAEAGKPKEERLYYDAKLKGMFGIRFRLDTSGENATSELIELPDASGRSIYPIFHQGSIFAIHGEIMTWDGRQSRVVREGRRELGTNSSNGAFLADGRLYSQIENYGEMKTGAINTRRTSLIRWIWAQEGREAVAYNNPVEYVLPPLEMPSDQQRKVMAQTGTAAQGGHFGKYEWFNDYKCLSANADRLYVRTFDNLYCFAPEVNGTLSDDPVKVASIRKETKADVLLPTLSSASAQERFEAVKRLGNLKQPLPTTATETLAKLLTSDPHDEIRLAALQTMDLCDPAGKAGWAVLTVKVFPETYGSGVVDYERRGESQKTLARLFDGLDPQGVAALLKHWSEAESDPVQRLALLDLATRLGWKDDAMVKSALVAAQDPKRWGHHPSTHILPRYFTAMQAAADPATADILVKTYAQNLSLEFTFRRHLSTDKYLVWLEPIAINSANPNSRGGIIAAWNKTGPAAIPSMKRVAAAMSGTDTKLDERGKTWQVEYRTAIEAAIAAMEKK